MCESEKLPVVSPRRVEVCYNSSQLRIKREMLKVLKVFKVSQGLSLIIVAMMFIVVAKRG